MMRFLTFFALLLLFVPFQSFSQTYFAETGADVIYQKSLDLGSDLNVLMISLQPGYEDLGALAYLRMGRGARILSAYITNGDATESDIREAYPHARAAIRRQEAFTALRHLNGQVYFLNMPDLPAARDSAKIRSLWMRDTLQMRLMRLISDSKPDLILISRDWAAGGTSLRWKLMVDDVLEAVRALQPSRDSKTLPHPAPLPRWHVGRVMVDEGDGKGVRVQVDSQHPRYKKTYRAIGEEAAHFYRSLVYQRDLWMKHGVQSYKTIFPSTRGKIISIDQNLPQPISQDYQPLQNEVRALASRASSLVTKGIATAARRRSALSKLVAVMDRIDRAIERAGVGKTTDHKILLHWKGGLEELRCALLDVKVYYTLYDSVFTNLQLGYLVIDSVTGIKGGSAQAFFPGIDQGWIVNESLQKQFDVERGLQVRLLSPKNLEYNFPLETHGLTQTGYGKPFTFFILHRAKKPEETFIKRIVLNFFYTPRFVVDVQTPIVRAVENERLAVRLMNNSRDGVRDQIVVSDSAVASTVGTFRINTKGGIHLDTLLLTWKQSLQEGTYVFPLLIGTQRIGQFGARTFDVQVDTSTTVGVISPFASTSTTEALRRLGIRWKPISLDGALDAQLVSIRVLVLDHRALTFLPSLGEQKENLRTFVKEGGRLIILAQDAEVWNASPLWDDMSLKQTQMLDEEAPLVYDSTARLMVFPNVLLQQAWNDWIFERASHVVSGEAIQRGKVLLQSDVEGMPLIVQIREGTGEIIYVALSLHHQLMNIHSGAFRLLANLIAY